MGHPILLSILAARTFFSVGNETRRTFFALNIFVERQRVKKLLVDRSLRDPLMTKVKETYRDNDRAKADKGRVTTVCTRFILAHYLLKLALSG